MPTLLPTPQHISWGDLLDGRVASSTNLTHAECRTRADALELASYDVELDLSRAADPNAGTFPSRSTVAFRAQSGDTWIDLIAELQARKS